MVKKSLRKLTVKEPGFLTLTMSFKINISDKGKTFKVELESEELIGKKIGERILGNEILPSLAGYGLEITGTSDIAGFAGSKDIEGPALRKILLTKGKFLKRVPHKGFRRKKTARGNEISAKVVQINMKVAKAGDMPLEQILGKKREGKAEKSAE